MAAKSELLKLHTTSISKARKTFFSVRSRRDSKASEQIRLSYTPQTTTRTSGRHTTLETFHGIELQ
jgi:hypothetical protein